MTVTLTSRFGLNQWGAGTDPFTRQQLDSDNSQIELLAAIDQQGTLASRPVAGKRGRYWYATDTLDLYRDDGTAWHLIYPGAGAPSAQNPGDALSTGVSRLWAAADHKHGLPPWSTSPSALTVGGASAGGSSSSFARGDHAHGMPAAGVAAAQSPGDAASAGASTAIALADHKHGLPPWAASQTDLTFAAGTAGVSNTFARGDHRHALPAAVARTDQTPNFPDVMVAGNSLPRGIVGSNSVASVNGPADTANSFNVGSVVCSIVSGRLYKLTYSGMVIRSDSGEDSALTLLSDGNGGAAIVQREYAVSPGVVASPVELTVFFVGAAANDFSPAAGAYNSLSAGNHTLFISMKKLSGSASNTFLEVKASQFAVEDIGTP